MKFIKKFWNIIKVALTLFIVGFFILYFIKNQNDFKTVFSTPYYVVIGLFLTISLHFFFNGLFILFILKLFDRFISGIESFYISTITSFANYFLPMQGGAVIRSVYLKKTYQFSYTYFVSTLYGNYIIIFGVNALFALISLLMIWIFYNTVPFVLFGFFGLLLFSMIALVFVKIKFNLEKIKNFKLARKFLNILNNILEGWEIIAKDKKLLMNLVMITVGNFILMTITFAIQFSTLDIQSNLLTILLYNCLSGVSLLISLTPGALGVREGIFFLNSNVLEITNEQIMQLALLDRGITILTLFFWFVVLSMWKLMSTKIKN